MTYKLLGTKKRGRLAASAAIYLFVAPALVLGQLEESWVRFFDDTPSFSRPGPDGLAVDGAGNVYAISSRGSGAYLVKYDPAGREDRAVLVDADPFAATRLAIDESGVAYVAGLSPGAGGWDYVLRGTIPVAIGSCHGTARSAARILPHTSHQAVSSRQEGTEPTDRVTG